MQIVNEMYLVVLIALVHLWILGNQVSHQFLVHLELQLHLFGQMDLDDQGDLQVQILQIDHLVLTLLSVQIVP